MSRVLLGVSGGIAAYKACELCRLLVKEVIQDRLRSWGEPIDLGAI